jgi:hypothetical protein
MKFPIFAVILAFSTTPAQATIDSWTSVLYPVPSMQEEGYCLVPALAWDGISNFGTRQTLAAQALSKPYRVQTQLNEGEDGDGLTPNINELAAAGITFKTDADWDKLDNLKLTITAPSRKLSTLEDRETLNRQLKLAIYAGVTNMFDSQVKKVIVEIKGLPDQTAMKNPIPAKFTSAFSKESPYLKSIETEIGIRGTGIEHCQ